ncbi:MAG: methyltransferase RsmF C-terminal domain-like protein [Candidatus Bilamarchaeum sp.]|jgi:NOL1/NOP2/fmu family ribosome biogenesis protein
MIQTCNIHIRKQVLDYLYDRFGIDSNTFSGLELYDCGNGRISLGPSVSISRPTMVSCGILIARIDAGIKPTSNLFHYLGHLVTKSVISLDLSKSKDFLQGLDIELDEPVILSQTTGYVLVRYENFNLGCAFLKGKTLRNQLPKSKQLGIKFM